MAAGASARTSQSSSSRSTGAAMHAGKVETFLVPGPIDAGKLAMAVAPLAAHIDLSCLVFFGLGVKPETIASVAGGSLGIHGMCPVFIADCYGIIGWDKKEKRNIELMEKGRGSEYGCPGGQGGEGVVVVAFRGKAYAAGGEGGSHMVVASHGKAELAAEAGGVSFGGYAKGCYQLEHSGDVVEIDKFQVASSSPAAVSSFDGDAAEAASNTSAAVGSTSAAAYFPCFCRGFNKYGADGVEPDAFASSGGLGGVPIFGMFAHGELGPPKGSPVAVSADEEPTSQHEIHSSTSILAVYA